MYGAPFRIPLALVISAALTARNKRRGHDAADDGPDPCRVRPVLRRVVSVLAWPISQLPVVTLAQVQARGPRPGNPRAAPSRSSDGARHARLRGPWARYVEDGGETRKPSVEPGLTNHPESLECDEAATAVDSTCKQATVAQPSCAGTR